MGKKIWIPAEIIDLEVQGTEAVTMETKNHDGVFVGTHCGDVELHS